MDGEPLKKMLVGVEAGEVSYALHLGVSTLPLAERIGQPFTLRFTGARTCMSCGKRVKKFYGQGLCYPCLKNAPEASECIVRPELCRAHLGEGRDPDWEKEHHLTEHFVYLSQTGGIKVGVTRATQIPVRWVDQGAVLAVLIARTPYRQLAGAIEVDLKRSLADKTDWRKMLQQVVPDPAALIAARDAAVNAVAPELKEYMLTAEAPRNLDLSAARNAAEDHQCVLREVAGDRPERCLGSRDSTSSSRMAACSTCGTIRGIMWRWGEGDGVNGLATGHRLQASGFRLR